MIWKKKIRNFFKNKKIIKRRTSYLHSKLNRFEKKLIIEQFDKKFPKFVQIKSFSNFLKCLKQV